MLLFSVASYSFRNIPLIFVSSIQSNSVRWTSDSTLVSKCILNLIPSLAVVRRGANLKVRHVFSRRGKGMTAVGNGGGGRSVGGGGRWKKRRNAGWYRFQTGRKPILEPRPAVRSRFNYHFSSSPISSPPLALPVPTPPPSSCSFHFLPRCIVFYCGN